MTTLKSVYIALPKGLGARTPPTVVATCGEAAGTGQKLAFTTSAFLDENRTTMSGRKQPTLQVEHQEQSSLLKTDGCIIRGKKRRLDHLTWEEKLQRKKLKNRVAAQTSRDRKKARLDELEDTVRRLREENEALTQECTSLRSENKNLLDETRRLRREREEGCSMCQARVGCAVSPLGSAASPVHPRQQGGAAEPAPVLTLTPGATILLKILTLYLLSKNYLVTSKETITSTAWKNSQKAFCERLPRRWKQILLDQMNKCPSQKIPLRNVTIRREWWGRHQKMWKPVEPGKA